MDDFGEPSSAQQAQDSHLPLTNGMARTASKRRRPSRSENGNLPADGYSQPPAAPEAPEAPNAPLSAFSSPPVTNGQTRPISKFPASFAERARILTERPEPQVTTSNDIEDTEYPPKPRTERRTSLNRPIGGLYSEIQQHKRDSYPSTASGPTSPRRFSAPSNSQPPPPQPAALHSALQDTSPAIKPGSYESSSPARPVQRHASAAQPPRKEWASDRSPLQNLEAKLEKRARAEQAEQRLRRSKAGSQRETRNVGLGVNIDPARNSPTVSPASAGIASSKLRRQSDPPLPKSVDGKTTENRTRDRSDRRSSEAQNRQLRTSSGGQRFPADSSTGIKREVPSTSSRRSSQNTGEVRRASQQQDRAVRFQGEDDPVPSRQATSYVNTSDSRRRRLDSQELELDEASAEARAARRDQFTQRTTPMADGHGPRDVPPQPKSLYGARTEQRNTSAASYSKVPEPALENTVQSKGTAPKYKVPPQTASGIHARQQIGFSDSSPGTGEVPAPRKHHLSDILHRGNKHAPHIHEQSGERSQKLDEWRQGGIARLTAADFLEEAVSKSAPKPWWENAGSGRRRKSQGGSRRADEDAKTLGDEYHDNTGKITSNFSLSRNGSDHHGSNQGSATAHARPYVSIDESPGPEKSLVSRFKANMAIFAGHSKDHRDSVLSSAYSYSCPELADHDPAHSDHFCEPLVSPELTQSMRSIRIRPVPSVQTFSPTLYLKCGPLLRYTGLRRESPESESQPERETWRGSVMIVTTDSESNYEPAPTLRLFPEPMELLPPPTQNVETEDRDNLPSEITDPIAGLPKLSRTGKTVYVKPADDLGEATDLSRLEDDDGLFEETRTAAVPSSYGTPEFHHVRNGPAPKTGPRQVNAKRGHRVRGVRLHAERGVTFWRFNLEVELGDKQARIAYSINNGPAVGFWVPARGHSMNVMFHSCNGFSLSVKPDDFSGPDPLWRDVLNCHQTRPFHVMIGGGDQIYNDAVMLQSPLFREWTHMKNDHNKFDAEFSSAMQDELETFYLERYAMWFSQGLFGMANSQIPMVNMWDDHDIIDGYGSYPHDFMSTPVFCGLGAVAYKYYMLFQHQSVPDETSADEPSWLMGAAPGPYISEISRSVFLSLGKNIAFLAVDCRTERQFEEVLSEASYHLVFDRCKREIVKGETKHLIVLLGIPIAYPRLVWLENILTSRLMDPIKALSKAGVMSSFLNKFDGGVEILDDLDDHWTAKHHKQERNWFIEELQELAAEKSVRITILGGDVHLAAIGRFYSNRKLKIPKDHDHRYMANVISSAIVNTPPAEVMGDILNKRNKTHHLDRETDEDMIPMFTHDVDGKTRNNKCLLPRRNWCSIREYHPGSTPPPTPSPPPSESPEQSDEEYNPPPPVSRIKRTMSLTRGDIKPRVLIRRLSGRGPPPASYLPPRDEAHSDSLSPSSPDAHFPGDSPPMKSPAATTNGHVAQRYSSGPLPRPGFQRRPTNLSEKAAAKGLEVDAADHVNLEHGLDVVLNCEVNQRDPLGVTTPYRLLIPALWYEGPGDENTLPLRKPSVLKRLTTLRGRRESRLADGQGRGNWGGEESPVGSEISGSESETEQEAEQRRPRRWSFGLTQRRQYRDQTPPLIRASREKDLNEDPAFPQDPLPERPQQHRQFEDRSQQIGQQNYTRAATQQEALNKLIGQKNRQPPPPTAEQLDGPDDDDDRPDSIDYHENLDTGRPQPLQSSGSFSRTLSKVDRMLGVGGARSFNHSVSPEGKRVSGARKGPVGGPGYFDDVGVDDGEDDGGEGYDPRTAAEDRREDRGGGGRGDWRRGLRKFLH